MRKRKYALVTGACGFIGSHLVEKLLMSGWHVIGFDILNSNEANNLNEIISEENFHYFEGDVRSICDVKKAFSYPVDTVFHLASVVGVRKYMDDPETLIDISFSGTKNIINECRASKARMLFSSTSEIFGKNPLVPWSTSADRILGPTSVDRWVYSTSKALCEHLLFSLHKNNEITMSIVRFFNAFGPKQSPIFLVSSAIDLTLRGQKPHLYDDGTATRCLTYIDDIIDGMIKAATLDEAIGESFNIGNPKEMTTKNIILSILKLCGRLDLGFEQIKTQQLYGRYYEDIPRRVPDIRKTETILHWKPKVRAKDGIRKTIEWAKENINLHQ